LIFALFFKNTVSSLIFALSFQNRIVSFTIVGGEHELHVIVTFGEVHSGLFGKGNDGWMSTPDVIPGRSLRNIPVPVISSIGPKIGSEAKRSGKAGIQGTTRNL
jgi:hypothetical protein